MRSVVCCPWQVHLIIDNEQTHVQEPVCATSTVAYPEVQESRISVIIYGNNNVYNSSETAHRELIKKH
jgi:hypothetical protein